MHAASLVLALISLMATASIPEVFVGAGRATLGVHADLCESDRAFLSVKTDESSAEAFLVLGTTEPCAAIGTAVNLGDAVFSLSGSWEEGFSGKERVDSPLRWSRLLIGPYGDGEAIPFSGCLDCGLSGPLDVFFEGQVTDPRKGGGGA